MIKKIIFSLILFAPTSAHAANEIILKHLADTPTESIYSLEAKNITHELVGISGTLKIPSTTKLTKYIPGNYFEKDNKEQSTYLIAPKKTNAQEILLGIVNLGAKSKKGSGRIVQLYFSPKINSESALFTLENTIASGNANGKRIDYQDIHWQIEKDLLPQSGSGLLFPIIISTIISIFFLCFCTLKTNSFSQITQIWYNYLKSKTKTYGTPQEKQKNVNSS